MNTYEYAYLASPYSHPDELVRTRRFWAACAASARLMREEGVIIFSPIAHSHPVALCGGLPTDWGFWQRYDETMLSKAGALYVLMLDGWETSVGVGEEIAIAQRLGLEIKYLLPQESDLQVTSCIAAA